jgi:hypothetical protein
MTEVLYAVEGGTDVPVAEKLIAHVGRRPRQVSASGGSGVIDAKLGRWAQPSNHAPMLILRDWDLSDGVLCPPALIDKIAGHARPANVAVRIAVRSMESWLMADTFAARRFFQTSRLPQQPELLDRPKLALVDACRDSRLRRVRIGMVPRPGSGGAVGADFALLIGEYAREHWDPVRAQVNAPSLRRAIARMQELVTRGAW